MWASCTLVDTKRRVRDLRAMTRLGPTPGTPQCSLKCNCTVKEMCVRKHLPPGELKGWFLPQEGLNLDWFLPPVWFKFGLVFTTRRFWCGSAFVSGWTVDTRHPPGLCCSRPVTGLLKLDQLPLLNRLLGWCRHDLKLLVLGCDKGEKTSPTIRGSI